MRDRICKPQVRRGPCWFGALNVGGTLKKKKKDAKGRPLDAHTLTELYSPKRHVDYT